MIALVEVLAVVEVLGLKVSPALLMLGLITGMTYGILAVGLVLVYRSNKIINFAHGEIGAFGAALCGVAVVRWGVPYWVAFVMAVCVSGSIGAVTEVAVVRRLRKAPKLMSLVATLGVAQFLLAFSFIVNSAAQYGSNFPLPPGLPEFHVGVLRVTGAYSGMLFVSPLLVLGLVFFLRATRYGLALRAAAANEERARMAGIFASRMSTLAWALAGGVSAFTAIMILPIRGFLTAEALGPVLLLRALIPAVIARMTNLPIALAAGVAIGLVEQVVLFSYPTGGFIEMFLFAVLIVALLFQAKQGAREDVKGEWAAVQPWRPLSENLLKVWSIRNLGRIAAGIGIGLTLLFWALASNASAVTLTAIVAFSLIGLSVGVATGLGGQLSLGQFAIAGVGAVASYHVVSRTGNFILGIAAAAAAAALASLFVALPAIRIRGLMLAVTTLSFALAAQTWLFQQRWSLSDGVEPGRPIFGSIALDTTKRYFLFAVAVCAIGTWLARNVWRGGVGLKLRAVRDNEDGARAFSVSAPIIKMQGFLLAGVVAGMGGAIYAHLLSRVSARTFDAVTSINVVALSVLGGIGLLAGPFLGAIYIIGIPRFLPLDSAGLAATSLGWLILILYFPGGIGQLIAGPRQRLISLLARRAGVDASPDAETAESPEAAFSSQPITLTPRQRRPDSPQDSRTILEVTGLTKYYGGIRAVDGVDFKVMSGETLGIIGPNGAGKTTLFELLSGFNRPDSGRVVFAGTDISRKPPEERAKRGLIRSFQDAALFPTMTVTEVVSLAYERAAPIRFVASVLGFQRPERRREQRARDLIGLMGLYSFRNKSIRELSTGTRRITELACVVALEPNLLLLDEPSSGIAQRETEALGDLLTRLKEYLDTTLIVIEHDIPLIMGISGRIMAMDTGRVIAEGVPEVVQNDPVVIESYLGSDVRAIERSGVAARLEVPPLVAPDGEPSRCRGVTRSGARCKRAAGGDGLCAQHESVLARPGR